MTNASYLCNSFQSMTEVSGFENLSGITGANQMFTNCPALKTICANSTWALPSSGITGSQCFYGCSTSLVGGNGTVWANSKTTYAYFSIDTASTPGYITVQHSQSHPHGYLRCRSLSYCIGRCPIESSNGSYSTIA